MKQLSLAETGFLPKAGKQTRKAVFLSEMETVVPWSRLEALIEPFYPKKGNGRPPMPLATMLRIHFLQQWFGYSDPAIEEALNEDRLICIVFVTVRGKIMSCSDDPYLPGSFQSV